MAAIGQDPVSQAGSRWRVEMEPRTCWIGPPQESRLSAGLEGKLSSLCTNPKSICLPGQEAFSLRLHLTQLPGRPSHPLKQINNLGTDFKLETRRSKIFKFHLLILLSEISQRGWKVKLVFPAEQSRALFEAGNLLDDKLLVAPPKVRQCVS